MVLSFAIGFGINNTFAQQAQTTPDKAAATPAGSSKKSTQSDAEFKQDYQQKMAKFDEEYQKLKQKEASTKDPQMKSDIDNILSKMDQAKSDMQNYEANASHMNDQEKQTAREHIKTEMGDIKQMHEAAKNKYGKEGKEGGKNQEQHQKAAGEKAPAEKNNEAKPANQHQSKEKNNGSENSANPK